MNHDKPVWDIGEVAKKQDEEKQEKTKWCPLLVMDCDGERCAWFIENNTWRADSGCAIAIIAKKTK